MNGALLLLWFISLDIHTPQLHRHSVRRLSFVIFIYLLFLVIVLSECYEVGVMMVLHVDVAAVVQKPRISIFIDLDFFALNHN